MIIDYGEAVICHDFCANQIHIYNGKREKIISIPRNWHYQELYDAQKEHEESLRGYVKTGIIYRICGEPFIEAAEKIRGKMSERG